MCLLSPCAGSFFNHQTLNINLSVELLLQLSMECHSDFHISWYILKIFKIQNNFLKFVDSVVILIFTLFLSIHSAKCVECPLPARNFILCIENTSMKKYGQYSSLTELESGENRHFR